jgi:hypothetical protein
VRDRIEAARKKEGCLLPHNEAIIRVGMESDRLAPILADFVESTASR